MVENKQHISVEVGHGIGHGRNNSVALRGQGLCGGG